MTRSLLSISSSFIKSYLELQKKKYDFVLNLHHRTSFYLQIYKRVKTIISWKYFHTNQQSLSRLERRVESINTSFILFSFLLTSEKHVNEDKLFFGNNSTMMQSSILTSMPEGHHRSKRFRLKNSHDYEYPGTSNHFFYNCKPHLVS